MKNIYKILFIGIAFAVTSCSELPEYELPYELSPTTELDLTVNSTTENAVCPGPEVTFTVDSESTVYYVVQPSDGEAPTSREIWEEGSTLSFEEEGSEELNFQGVELEEAYTIYAVTVNQNGIRSEEVTSAAFTVASFDEIVNASIASEYVGTAYYNGTPIAQFSPELTAAEEGYVFNAQTLWGDVVAALTGDAGQAGAFPYPGDITLNEDFSLTVVGTEDYGIGGGGSYDPCTGTFSFTLEQAVFANPFTIDVVIAPGEAGSGEGDGEDQGSES